MKVLAVTGGAQGIGRAIALRFAREGYAVSIADPAEDAGREMLDKLREAGVKAVFEPANIAEADQVARWVERTTAELGCPDVLVNNAGIARGKPFLELAPEDFDAVIGVNLRGTFLCSQAVARAMVGQGKGGAIVNIASTRAFMSEAGTEAYTASKGGIVALTHGMAISLGGYGIRVNCISPGWIETSDWQFSARSRTPRHSDRDRLQHPVGRVGSPEDVAEACLFLVQAGFMTGQNITLDGGMTVKMIYEE
ncbi:SDR family NAD(P)-dependent oxidoreductase [Telmatospirillum sp. J64-1]|uniref:SDR family NAD(P)-dependent oxidoreductase n=1 Tax=Telmatospirillum sp. J64-1 TaxID=2502183 RepID=UPI00115EE463|nr:glucose 1-dehydrogenase [Telmatospirillum sp. J64-1]